MLASNLPRNQKSENRKIRKEKKSMKIANRKPVKTFLNEEEKEIVKKAFEGKSKKLHDQTKVIETVLNVPHKDNLDLFVEAYMKEHDVKEVIVHRVKNLFKGFMNAKIVHVSHASYVPETTSVTA